MQEKPTKIEIMACPGGCRRSGQPQPVNADVRAARTAAVYKVDEVMTIRQSHKTRMSSPCTGTGSESLSEESHHLLHTHYKHTERV